MINIVSSAISFVQYKLEFIFAAGQGPVFSPYAPELISYQIYYCTIKIEIGKQA